MVNALKLSTQDPIRLLLMGTPGSGKTGALCSLIDAGYKLRVLDFDGLFTPVLQFVKNRDMLANVDVVSLEDKMILGPDTFESKGVPTALATAAKMLNNWKYTEDGQEVDLGKSVEWGPDTIVVLDSLTTMGDAAMQKALSIAGKTASNMRDKDWGTAMSMQEGMLKMLRAKSNRFHLIVLAHLRTISPAQVRQGDDAITKEIKEQMAELSTTRVYPRALGRDLPPKIPGYFDTVLLAERQVKANGKEERVIRSNVGSEMDVKLPVPSGVLPPILPQATGLLEVFKAIAPWSLPSATGETRA